ncbi:hypothetical protein MBLNU230_g5311t1 [Neophaeotheca triangularis]
MRTRAQAADGSDLIADTQYIANCFELGEEDVKNLLNNPTADGAKTFIEAAIHKAQDMEKLKSEKLRVEVEFEHAVRTSENKAKTQKATITKHADELKTTKAQLTEANAKVDNLTQELDTLQATSSGSTAEAGALRSRIDTLEASNLDLKNLMESRANEKDSMNAELKEQHEKLVALRREVSSLAERNQSLENSVSSQKFKEQGLQQEITQLKQHTEWQATELETRGADHTKYRKERNARLAELERELEDATTNTDNLKRTESGLRKRLDEMQTKAEEAYARITALQEKSATNERNLREDIASTKRLAELHEQNARTHKGRVQELEKELESQRQDYTKELGQLTADIDEENASKNDAYQKVADLEIKVKDLEEQLQDSLRTPRQATIANRRMSSHFATPSKMTPSRMFKSSKPTPSKFNASQAGTPMNSRTGRPQHELSWQQLSDQNNDLTEELAAEGRRCERLQKSLEDMMNELEARKPDVEKMREEQERLENEVYQYSLTLEEAHKARDEAKKAEGRWRDEAAGFARENELKSQQLRDHCVQIKLLVTEQIRREQGMAEPTFDESVALERAARGQFDNATLDILDPDNGTRFVSENLVAFRTATQMQQQNERLLRTVRDAAEKVDAMKAEKNRRVEQDGEETESLRKSREYYKEQAESLLTTVESYVQERNMYRRILKSRGRLPDGMNQDDIHQLFGQSAAPTTPGPQNQSEPAVPQTPSTARAAQAAAEAQAQVLKEQTIAFDNFRENAYKEMREKENALKTELNNMQAELTKAQGQVYSAEGRLSVYTDNYKALQAEHTELRKHSHELENHNKALDFKAIALSEDVVEFKAKVSSLEQKIESLKDHQKTLEDAKQHAISDLEKIRTEREEWQSKIQDVERLSSERNLQHDEAMRTTLDQFKEVKEERDTVRKERSELAAELKRESEKYAFEKQRFRDRSDEMMKTIEPLRLQISNFDGVKAEKQARIDELSTQLTAAQDKLRYFQPQDDEWEVEERRRSEVDDLKTKLRYAEEDLERSREQYNNMNQIAKQTQEDLDALNESSEAYQEEMDELIATKDARIAELEQRVVDLTTELTQANSELAELKEQQEDSNRDFAEQKRTLEAKIVKLEDDATRFSEERKAFVEDLKAQGEIARTAQTHYEEELVRHAEATQSLNNTKKEYNELREKSHELKVAAMTAKDELDTAKNNWEGLQEQLEEQLRDARMRKDSADDHINNLHDQLKKYASELETIRQNRLNSLTGGPASAYQHDESGMQAVIDYLRREKEMLQVNHDKEKRDSRRYQHELQYARDEMEKAREKLREEIRASEAKISNPTVFSQLEETLRELNTYRESTVHLRDEARRTREKLEAREKEVEKLREELEPLKQQVFELETNMEYKDQDLRLTTEDRNNWRDRTHRLMNKHGVVDAEELTRIKQQITDLEADKERLENERVPLQEQIDAFEVRLEAETAPLREKIEAFDATVATAVQEATAKHSETLTKFKAQAKEQNRKQNERLTEMRGNVEAANASVATANAAKEETDGQLAAKVAELEQAQRDLEDARAKASVNAGGQEEGEVNEDGESDHAALHARIAEAEQHASNHSGRAEALSVEVQTLQTRVQELEGQVSQLQNQATQLQGELETAKSASANTQVEATAETSKSNEDVDLLENVRSQLETAQQELEALRANAASTGDSTTTNAEPAEGERSVADQVAEECAKLRQELEAQHEVAIKQVEQNRDERIARMKDQLRERLKEERKQYRETLTTESQDEHNAELQKLREEHDAVVVQLKEEHAAAVEKLKVDFEAELKRVTEASAGQSVAEGEAGDQSEATAPPKAGSDDSELTDEQARDLLKRSPFLRTVIQNNVKKHSETHRARIAELEAQREQLIAEKDAKIAQLEQDIKNASPSDDGDLLRQQLESVTRERDELKAQLETLNSEKETLNAEKETLAKEKQQALMESKKKDVFVAVGRNAKAQWTALEAAVKEAPDQPLKPAFDVAAKVKAPPLPNSQKPAPATPSTASKTGGSASSPAPASTQVKQETTGSAETNTDRKQSATNIEQQSPTKTPTSAAQAAPAAEPSQESETQQKQGTPQQAPQPQSSEQQKMQERAARFGAVKQPSPSMTMGSSFGKPSAGLPAKPQGQGSFGQPGKNPTAPSFNFAGASNQQQQPQQGGPGPGRGSGLPQPAGSRLPGPANRGANNASGLPRAGGHSQGRGGGNASGLPRGGRGGGAQRGGGMAANAGQKRSNPTEHTGDEKRMRGGEGDYEARLGRDARDVRDDREPSSNREPSLYQAPRGPADSLRKGYGSTFDHAGPRSYGSSYGDSYGYNHHRSNNAHRASYEDGGENLYANDGAEDDGIIDHGDSEDNVQTRRRSGSGKNNSRNWRSRRNNGRR